MSIHRSSCRSFNKAWRLSVPGTLLLAESFVPKAGRDSASLLPMAMAAASSKQCPAPDKRNSSYGGESLPAPISRHTTVLHNMCGSKK